MDGLIVQFTDDVEAVAMTMSRRLFLQSSARAGLALGAIYGLGACGEDNATTSKQTLTWWDDSNPRFRLNQKMLAEWADELGGAKVQITFQQNAKIGQALQLARQSGQLPDLTPNAGLGFPLPALIEDGWYQPLDLPDEARSRLEALDLVEGIHIFDGKPYVFPQWSNREYSTITWFNTELLSKAGVDPAQPPGTYDEFRAACKAVRKLGKNVYGWLLDTAGAGRIGGQIGALAQAGGFEGTRDGQLFRTGEYAYDSEPFVNAIEFFRSMARDDLMVPSTGQLNANTGRARWVTGVAAFFFDGPWVPGNVVVDFPAFMDKLGVAPMLTPDPSHQVVSYAGRSAAGFFITGDSKNTELANKVLGLLLTDDYQKRFAAIMGHVPHDPTVLDDSDVPELYRKLCRDLAEHVFHAPMPIVGNTEVAKVDLETKPVDPPLGQIVKGYLSGDVTDLRGALRKLTDASNKELERAIGAATAKGAKVDRADFAFPDWKPRSDFTKDMY